MKTRRKTLNTKRFIIETKEVDEGVIIDVFDKDGDIINSHTYWNDCFNEDGMYD